MLTKKIQWTDREREFILEHGEVCIAVAKSAMERSRLNFDDIEDINQHYETHRWGSDADRRYRKRAINKAIEHIAKNAAAYLPDADRKAYYNGKILERIKAAVIAYEKEKLNASQSKKWDKIVNEYNAAFEAAEAENIPDDEQMKVVNQAIKEAKESF